MYSIIKKGFVCRKFEGIEDNTMKVFISLPDVLSREFAGALKEWLEQR